MAKKTWVIASQEGADFSQAELGAPAELDLTHQQEKAMVAAGWIEEPEEPKQQKKKEG